MSRHVLITRPKKQAIQMAEEITALGLIPLIAPVLKLQPIPFECPDLSRYEALLITSANAVRIFTENTDCTADIFKKKVYSVGQKTASVLSNKGFTNINCADGNVQDLISLIAKQAPHDKPYLHIRGHHAARPLHVWLAQYDIQVDILPVYKTEMIDHFDNDIIEHYQKRDIGAVIHMSPRSATAYAKIIAHHDLAPLHDSIKSLSISPAVLDCTHALPWKEMHAADAPNKASLLQKLQEITA